MAEKTCSGIELADLCSYPIFKYIKTGQKDIAFKTIENKLMGYPEYEGKGIIKIL